jgi:hypothetical protein
MQDVSVWIPHAQTSSFLAGCIEMPLSCLVDAVNRYERECHFYAKGKCRGNQRAETKKAREINRQLINLTIIYL